MDGNILNVGVRLVSVWTLRLDQLGTTALAGLYTCK